MPRKRYLNKNESSAKQVIGNPETDHALMRLASVLIEIIQAQNGGSGAKNCISGSRASTHDV